MSIIQLNGSIDRNALRDFVIESTMRTMKIEGRTPRTAPTPNPIGPKSALVASIKARRAA